MGLPLLLILGLGVIGGLAGAWLCRRLRVPQVVGYLLAGLLIGESGLKLADAGSLEHLGDLNVLALGIIGFLVGGELQFAQLRRHGRQYLSILVGEGLAATVLTGAVCTLAVYLVSGSLAVGLAAGLVLGGIAAATDPASTLDVLWEYRARGVLTAAIIAVVALDDILAMTLYATGKSGAQLIAGSHAGLAGTMGTVAVELLGALLLGTAAGLALAFVVRRLHDDSRALAVVAGVLLLVLGACLLAELDVILAAMALGVTLANAAPRRAEKLLASLRGAATPIYILFFVLVGARLNVHAMPGWVWLLAVLFALARGIGKILGAAAGATLGGAPAVLRRYCGLGLFAQGGVAIGLAMVAGERLDGIAVTAQMSVGDLVVLVLTASTLMVQLIGPPLVKLAVTRAGETGRRVTAEDVIASWQVRQVMELNLVNVPETLAVRDVLELMGEHDLPVCPVVDEQEQLRGVIGLEELRQVMVDGETRDWLVAADIMCPPPNAFRPEMPLPEALQVLHDTGSEWAVVVNGAGRNHPVGLMRAHRVHGLVGRELLRRQQPDVPALATA